MPRALPPADVVEGADAPASTATTLNLGLHEVFEGRVGIIGDTDWVRVNLTAGQTYVFRLWGTQGGVDDTLLTLRDSRGVQLRSNDDLSEDNFFSQITYTASASGTFYLQAAAAGSDTGAYRLQASTDVFTLEEIATQLAEIEWSEPWPLAFAAGQGSVLSVNLTGLTSAGQQLARWALEAWSEVTGLVFSETTSSLAAITFNDHQAGAFAGPSSYNPATGVINRSNVNISTSWLSSYGTTIDSYSYTTYLHEIGHALGLGHGGHYNGSARFGVDNHYRNDNTLMSVMSYFDPRDNPFHGSFSGDPITAMPADVLAMWTLYGKPTEVQGGDTVWGVGSTVGGTLGRVFSQVFDGGTRDSSFYSGDTVFLTMTDTGGYDLLNLQRFSAAAVVDLNAGGISTSAGWKAVLVTGPQTAIEAVKTGTGNDRITGNAAEAVNHRIWTSGGNDTVTGGIGSDTVIGGGGKDHLTGSEGGDLLLSETFQLRHNADLSAQVYRLYEAVLGRAPDPAGHRAWTTAVALGEIDLASVRDSFMASQEFQNVYGALDDPGLLSLLYFNVLGRTASAFEINGWLSAIAGGMSRAEVVRGFADSAEFIAATAATTAAWTATRDAESWTDDLFRLYQATLARDPDLAGLQSWAAQLATNPVLEDVAVGFIGSIEFQRTYGALDNAGFVSLLYQNVLGRVGAASEINAWLARMNAGETRAEVLLGFSQSREFVANSLDDLVDWMRSTSIADRLEGGAGNDTLAGGFGADTFVFDLADGAGADQVVGYEAWDLIELRGFGYGSAADAMGHFSQSGADVVFEDAGVRVVFEDTTLGQFGSTALSFWS